MKPKINIRQLVYDTIIDFLKEFGDDMAYGQPGADLFWIDSREFGESLHVNEFYLDGTGTLCFREYETTTSMYNFWRWDDVEEINLISIYDSIYEFEEKHGKVSNS